jgi:hypothetical protein
VFGVRVNYKVYHAHPDVPARSLHNIAKEPGTKCLNSQQRKNADLPAIPVIQTCADLDRTPPPDNGE